MLFSPRRVAVAAIVAGGLTVVTAPASYAVVDPAHAIACLAESPNGLTGAVDPAGVAADPLGLLAVPEIPGTNCLAP